MFRFVETVKRPSHVRRRAVLVAAAALLAVFVAGAAGASAPSFVPRAVLAAGSRVVKVAVADFNGDGRPDLAVASASYRSNDVSVLLGGVGGFRPGPDSPVELGSVPAGAVPADFNGDGKVDLAVSRYDWENGRADKVSILLGDGAGGLSAAAGSPLVLAGLAAVSDLNDDGKPDLIGLDSEGVAVLLGDGSGRFAPALGSPTAAGLEYANLVAVADFNRDGKPDLAVAEKGLSILLGTGSGRFGAARKVKSEWVYSLAVADFSGDGKVDLAVAGKKLSISLGNGTGGFSQAPGSPADVDLGHGMTTADFNRDGKIDVAGATDDAVVVLLGNGAGRFHRWVGSPLGLPLRFSPRSLAATDLNADGKLDLVAMLNGSHGNGEEDESRLAVLLQARSSSPRAAVRGRALPSSAGRRLSTRGAITMLAADGHRAAAITSRVRDGLVDYSGFRVMVWTASSRKATSFETRYPDGAEPGVEEVAIGGSRVAWIAENPYGSNTVGGLDVFAARLSGGPAKRIDRVANACGAGCGPNGPTGVWVSYLLGDGPLLAYNKWRAVCDRPSVVDPGFDPSCPWWLRVATTSLVRVAAGRPVVAKRGAGSYRLAAVGGGRMAVASAEGAVAVLATSGARVASVTALNGDLPQAVALSRTHLAVERWSPTLDLYNPANGRRMKSLPLGSAAGLELAGVNGRLALLRGSQELVLVRLRDGKLVSLPLPREAANDVVDAKLTEAGLFYAYNTPKAAMKGRIVFEPTAKLLARF